MRQTRHIVPFFAALTAPSGHSPPAGRKGPAFQRPAAQQHALEEYFKIVDDGRHTGVQLQVQHYGLFLAASSVVLAFFHRVVHTVVDVKVALSRLRTRVGTSVLSAKISAGPQRSREGRVVVVADGRAHGCDLIRGHAQLVQNTERHHRAALGMVDAVDDVADVVHIPGDPRQLLHAPGIAQVGWRSFSANAQRASRVRSCAQYSPARPALRLPFQCKCGSVRFV